MKRVEENVMVAELYALASVVAVAAAIALCVFNGRKRAADAAAKDGNLQVWEPPEDANVPPRFGCDPNLPLERKPSFNNPAKMEEYDDTSSEDEVTSGGEEDGKAAGYGNKKTTEGGDDAPKVKVAGANIRVRNSSRARERPTSMLSAKFNADATSEEIDAMMLQIAAHGGVAALEDSSDEGDLGTQGYSSPGDNPAELMRQAPAKLDEDDFDGFDGDAQPEAIAEDSQPAEEPADEPAEPEPVKPEDLRSLLKPAAAKEQDGGNIEDGENAAVEDGEDGEAEGEGEFDSKAEKIASRFGGSFRGTLKRQA